jgi:hypothetical protein
VIALEFLVSRSAEPGSPAARISDATTPCEILISVDPGAAAAQADQAVYLLPEAPLPVARSMTPRHKPPIISAAKAPRYRPCNHRYRARLFHAVSPYPWAADAVGRPRGPRDDLAAARKLIEKCGYWRRKEELEDAETAARHWPA